jgi:hypothetical protein
MLRVTMLALTLAVGGLGGPALAQTAEQRAASEGDARKLCAGVTVGGGRIAKCLAENKEKVSANCRKALKI